MEKVVANMELAATEAVDAEVDLWVVWLAVVE